MLFLFSSFMGGVDVLRIRGDDGSGAPYRYDTTHIDVFMALFMICTIEIVVLKVMIINESTSSEEQSDVSSTLQIRED